MSIEAAKALRAKLRNDAALTDFFQSHYGKAAIHRIGYKQSQNANDFPIVSYVVPKADLGDPSGTRMTVSVVVGVNAPGITDDVFDGVAQVDAVAGLIMAAIEVGTLDSKTLWLGTATVVGDMGMRHPFYETEIILPLLRRG